MVRKSYTPEQILNKLRETEILLNQGTTLSVVWKKIGVGDSHVEEYYKTPRWRLTTRCHGHIIRDKSDEIS